MTGGAKELKSLYVNLWNLHAFRADSPIAVIADGDVSTIEAHIAKLRMKSAVH
jgi:hypothetical protein